MRNDQTDSSDDGSAADREPRRPAGSGGTFPTHAVVGVIDDPRELAKAVEEMRAAGFDPGVLHGELGEQRIRQAGDVPRDLTLTRFTQGVFGYEAEHTERHMQEIEDGNFVGDRGKPRRRDHRARQEGLRGTWRALRELLQHVDQPEPDDVGSGARGRP